MRRPGRHPASSSPTPAAATTTAATAAVSTSKTGPKMTWKRVVVKIRGKRKLSESIAANNPENRKSRAAAAVLTAMVNSPTRAHSSKSSLLSKKGSFPKAEKRVRAVISDPVQTKHARRNVLPSKPDGETSSSAEIPSSDRDKNELDEAADQNHMVQDTSASPASCKEEQHEETNGSSNLLVHSTDLAPVTQSSPIDISEKKMENLDQEMETSSDQKPMCSTSTNSRELDEEEKRLILADFDTGMLPHEIEEKYGISKLQIADVLSNRISIFRQQIGNWSDLFAVKRRRTVYVRLNMQMWNYFCQCRDRKIWLNGRQMKEQALKIANELGLHSFKASEGWLDSFKRRHSIDLKAMTGKPVIYEMDLEEDRMENNGLEIKISRSATPSPKFSRDTNSLPSVLDANQFLMDAADAAVFASSTATASDSGVGMASPTQATAAIKATTPLDIQRFLPTPSVVNEPNVTFPAAPNVSGIGASAVQALVETCCYRVNEVEVSQAVDTLRAYIVSNNISLLPVLVELQKGLAAIAAQRKTAEKVSNGMQHGVRTSQDINYN